MLSKDSFWKSSIDRRTKSGRTTSVRVSPQNAANRLALTEFNTWYIHGFARRLMEEGEEKCQASYRLL